MQPLTQHRGGAVTRSASKKHYEPSMSLEPVSSGESLCQNASKATVASAEMSISVQPPTASTPTARPPSEAAIERELALQSLEDETLHVIENPKPGTLPPKVTMQPKIHVVPRAPGEPATPVRVTDLSDSDTIVTGDPNKTVPEAHVLITNTGTQRVDPRGNEMSSLPLGESMEDGGDSASAAVVSNNPPMEVDIVTQPGSSSGSNGDEPHPDQSRRRRRGVKLPATSSSRPMNRYVHGDNHAPAEAAPIDVPVMPTGPITSLMKGGTHFGDNSVTPVNVAETAAHIATDVGQDIIKRTHELLRARTDVYYIDLNGITITNTVSIPSRNYIPDMINFEQTFNRRIHNVDRFRNLQLKWDNSDKVGSVDPGVKSRFISVNNVEYRLVSSVMRAELAASTAFMNGICQQLSLDDSVYDPVGVFIIGHIIYDYMLFLEANDIPWVAQPAVEGHITNFNVATDEAGANAQLVIAFESITRGRIPMRASLVPSAMWNVLWYICQGPAGLQVQAGARRFIHSYITTDPVRFVIWDNVAVVPPARQQLTAPTFLAGLRALAITLKAEYAYVRGYVRAQSMLTGVECVNPDSGEGFWVTSGLEIDIIRAPRPRGSNAAWNLLTTDYVFTFPINFFEHEWMTMTSMSDILYIAVGAAISAVYSLATSTVLNHYNFSARELNSWASGVASGARQFFMALIGLTDTVRAPTTLLQSTAVNVVTQLTGMSLSWRCFVNSMWSNNMQHRVLGPNEGWAAVWHVTVPYLTRPETMEWYIIIWLAEWGISAANPSYDTTAETFICGPENGNGLFIYRGDNNYNAIRVSSTPFRYNPYGIFMLTTLKQDLREDHRWVISFRYARKSKQGTVMLDVQYDEVNFQPQYDVNTFSVVPGTLLTYDWSQDVVIYPSIRRNHMRDRSWYAILSSDGQVRCKAGYCTPSRATVSEVFTDTYNVRALVGAGARAVEADAPMPEHPGN